MRLFKFGAEWCQPCKALDATLDRVLRDFPHIELIRVDIEADRPTAAEHNVQSVPTLVTDTGRRFQGNVTEGTLRRWLAGSL